MLSNRADSFGKRWDIVILGGGLGGLSFAVELCSGDLSTVSVLVLEKRDLYTRDRTWSYWSSEPHRYSHLERKVWEKWSIASRGVTHEQRCPGWRYASIDADNFYNAALEIIRSSPNVALQTCANVTHAERLDHLETVVSLSSGESIRAGLVLDARPPSPSQASGLVQQFFGREICTEQDIFDPNVVQLMHFEPNANGVHFFYVLPYSARCALVESTWISQAAWRPNLGSELNSHLKQTLGPIAHTVTYQEHGVLSLQSASAPSEKHRSNPCAGLGRLGGTLRNCTGYAFLDTVNHAQQLADSLRQALKEGGKAAWLPLAFERSRTDRWMDEVFLRALMTNWFEGPGYFMQMFGTVDAVDNLAFLTGRATWRQRLRIMRALPFAPFAKAALSQRPS